MPEQPPSDCSGISWYMWCAIFQLASAGSRTKSRLDHRPHGRPPHRRRWRWRPGPPPGLPDRCLPGRCLPGRCRSCCHLGEYLLGGELVPVGAARMLADGGDEEAELVVPGDPELDSAG